jgi:hypothetical protein
MSKCEICGTDLAEYEEPILDCGHYACNSCTYSRKVRTGLNVDECAKCFEAPMTDDEKTEEKEK